MFSGFLCLGNLDAGHMGIWDLGIWYLGTLVFASPEGTWHHRCVKGRPHEGFRHLGQGSCWRHSTCKDMAFQKEENSAESRSSLEFQKDDNSAAIDVNGE